MNPDTNNKVPLSLPEVVFKQHKEVARLRKYVELIEIFSPENEWSFPQWRKLIGSKEENEDPETLFNLYQFRLAPAPKEPETSANPDKCIGNVTEPISEWRELGPDEVIQEGDEQMGTKDWYPFPPISFGKLKKEYAWACRTRRPLPVKEEIPLDAEIAFIEWSCAHTAKAIRYLLQQINTLRDEIQRIDRALNVGEEDSSHNFVEINKLRNEIQKLKYNQEIYEDAGQNIINRIVKLEQK
jgi:hypothetical protein